MGAAPRIQRVVVCSAPEDEELRAQLDAHLSLLERRALIATFHSGLIAPGLDRASVLGAEILGADVILLLISASFLDSDECYRLEMEPAVARYRRGEALVIPILLRPVDWKGAPFDDLPCLPENLLAVTLWRSVDEALVRIEQGLRRALAEGMAFRSVAEPPAKAVSATQERLLDAAVAPKTVVGEQTEVLAMVTTTGSGGLRALIASSPEAFLPGPGDVTSTDFELEFPLDAEGHPRAAALTVHLSGKDFDPPAITRKLLVPPRSDSAVCTLLVTPRRAGHLRLALELRWEDALVGSARLMTTGELAPAVAPRSYVLTRVPLSTASEPSSATSFDDEVPISPPPATESFFEKRSPGMPSPPLISSQPVAAGRDVGGFGAPKPSDEPKPKVPQTIKVDMKITKITVSEEINQGGRPPLSMLAKESVGRWRVLLIAGAVLVLLGGAAWLLLSGR